MVFGRVPYSRERQRKVASVSLPPIRVCCCGYASWWMAS